MKRCKNCQFILEDNEVMCKDCGAPVEAEVIEVLPKTPAPKVTKAKKKGRK